MRLRPLLLLAAMAASATAQDPAETSYRFRVQGPFTELQRAVLLREYDFLTCEARIGDQPFDVIVQPHQLAEFHELGLRAALIERGQPFSLLDAPDPNYYTTAEVEAEIDAAVAAYPALARKIDVTTLPGGAKTHNGNSIWAIKISDNVAADEDEPAMVMAAQHHARELNSPHMTIRAFQRILSTYATDPQMQAVVDSYEIYIVPTANPDGVDHVWCCDNFWRKNRRDNGNGTFGVDLNRNFPFLWGRCGASTNPGSDTYRGPSAGSEPATMSMIALVAAVRPEVYLDFHSFGREVLFLYPPCASVSEPIRALANHYIDDLRTPMNYRTRLPSASGEAPHDHWASGGAMSLLIEVGTSFQPAFSQTVAEEARVWPGIERVLKTWRPSLRGHVTSIFQNRPVVADVTYSPNVFAHGEQSKSRARDGRYSVWLAPGITYQVTFSAPGFQSETRTVQAQAFNSTITLDVELVPTGIAPGSLAASGSNQVGTTTQLTYTSPGESGEGYWIALSGGTQPGLAIGSRTIPLNADGLLYASATPGMVLTGNIGTLGAGGVGTAALPIPAVPQLAGLTLHSAGLTLNGAYNFAVKTFSPAVALTIQP